MKKKCLVKTCSNTEDQGKFIGDLCYPCHQCITTGKIDQRDPVFKLLSFGLTQNELDLVNALRRIVNERSL